MRGYECCVCCYHTIVTFYEPHYAQLEIIIPLGDVIVSHEFVLSRKAILLQVQYIPGMKGKFVWLSLIDSRVFWVTRRGCLL